MSVPYLTDVPLDQARREYRGRLRERGFGPEAETVPVGEACGRVTSLPVYARICAPSRPASAMDGIALDARLTSGASGTAPVTLGQGDFTAVNTGDPIPDGCDAVVMTEDVVRQEDGTVRLHTPCAPWQHIRQIGEDICAGEMILASHTVISPSAIGAMLAAGVPEVSVLRRPVVGIIPAAGPEPINSSIFSAMLVQWNAVPKIFPAESDGPGALRDAVGAALAQCDIVLLNAGPSSGGDDCSAAVIREMGEILCRGIAMKPGRPAILGYQGKKPILGVPGHPVSGILVLTQLLRPLIDDWFRAAPAPEAYREATLSRAVASGVNDQEFVRVRLGQVGGRLMASPLSRGSGMVSSFMKADGILEIPQGAEGFAAGSQVRVRLLRRLEELENTLVATGSHDPLLDEAADLLHLADPALHMSSTHVGSMGGIMAVRRGETHVAGIHLLDERDGSYNTAFIRRYFPHGGVRLVECAGRTQGLMLPAGNPRGIHSLEDLSRKDLRYVNRQKGSGTRILMDYLCKTHGLDPAKIRGYGREEFTHTSVAAQIAAGTADAGMGIYSAAKLYGLDFLPVCTEQYDLLIPDAAFDTPMVQCLLDVLRGEAFRGRLEALGGYRLERPGSVRGRF